MAENQFISACRRFVDAFGCRDWASFAEAVAEDAVLQDYRRLIGTGAPAVGREAFIRAFTTMVDVGFDALEVHEPFFTRGDRLALLGGVARAANGFELDVLILGEADGDGRCSLLAYYDHDDLDRALVALEERSRLPDTSLRYPRSESGAYLAHAV